MTKEQTTWAWAVTYPYQWGMQTRYFTTEEQADKFINRVSALLMLLVTPLIITK